jgi:MFS family permease
MSTTVTSDAARPAPRRLPPEMVIAAGCVIAILTFGPRSAVGVFQLPILREWGWGSDTFSYAMALQYLFWGMGQPFAGAMADRFGSARVLTVGLILYGSGLALMSWASTPLSFTLTAGVLMGFGLSGCSFNLVIGALAKLVPEKMRGIAFGAGTAAGSFGQFLFSPIAGGMVENLGWHFTTIAFGLLMLLVIPLCQFVASAPMNTLPKVPAGREQSFKQALVEAFQHKSYVLLVLGFFTCGFQLAFVTVHFQKYVVEAGIPPQVGYWAFALVGIFNIFGSLSSGWLSGRMPKRWVLSGIYLSRALVTLLFIMLPPTAWSAYLFGALSGFLWLSTVPPTSSLIGVMFGTRYFSTIYGFAFLSHQIGGFTGLMISGWVRESTGSYAAMWWLSIGFGVFSALVNLPIVEKPIERKSTLAPA